MAKIVIKELKAQTTIGVHAFERKIKQTVVLDVEMEWDIGNAAQSDDLTQSLDYASIAESLTTTIENHQTQLLERLILILGQVLEEKYAVTHYKLYLRKPHVLSNVQEVGVILER
ncbi:MAG: dihydroneopterin aldolase [Legionellales bacterium]|nr:dihydroneopterin aldolase [Legionellales bacterium]